jgi:hypothetical protein
MSPRRRDTRQRLGGMRILHNVVRRPGRSRLLLVLLGAMTAHSSAFTIAITQAPPPTVYLQIGVGTFTSGFYSQGGTPGNNTTVNSVSVNVPASAVGNQTAQAMTTDSAVSASSYDGRTFCTAPTQLYVGGFYRRPGNGGGNFGTLTASILTPLTNAAGNIIPFSQISWTSSGIGDSGAEPFPSGTFPATGTQSIGTIARNQWAESCWTFSYANTLVPAAGTYTGVVLYTLTAP